MPHTVRLPYISFNVAYVLAVTVQSRVAGLVTIGPTITLRVSARIWLKITYGSCHKMWLSNVQTWEKPNMSAFLARSITRADGGVVCNTTPMSIALPYVYVWLFSVLTENRDRSSMCVGLANVM